MKDALQKSQHPTPTRTHNSLHQWTAPNYGSTALQMAHLTDDSPAIYLDEAGNVQQLVGTFLYYTRAVDPTMLVTLNKISYEQSKITQETEKKVVQILNYAATQPEAITRYLTGGMTMHIHSKESFLSYPGDKIRAGGYHYLSETPTNQKTPPTNSLHSMDPSTWNVTQ